MSNLSPHCEGCGKIVNEHCSVYVNPIVMMRWVDNPKVQSGCAFNRANIIRPESTKKRVRIGQQKQRKRR